MPMRFRHDASPIRPPSPEPSEPADADDSIVLSDLVRTGEASRLRRRGAMRLDRNLLATQRNETGRVTPPSVVVERTTSWIEPPSDDDESTQAWEQGYDPSPPRPQTGSEVPRAEASEYTLYCGGEEPCLVSAQQMPFYVRSPLPLYPPTPPDPSTRRFDDPPRGTNGCGAVIHLRASRRHGSSVWIGKDEATSAVVPMDAAYFERPTVVRMIRSGCGCVREGVGCAICGNTLGTRYKPCQTAADGLFSLHHISHAPICPQGPSYWHGRIPTTSLTSPHYVYTFFASNVTCASPSPVFRVLPSSTSPREESFYSVDSTLNPNFIDRVTSASPAPMTDEDRNALDQSSRAPVDPDFDPDGTSFLSDPGSPDKSSSELMLLPDR